MATSVPSEPRWTPGSPPAEQTVWRWAVEQLDERILVLPQVSMTVGSGGRVEEAEADLVLIDPEHGVTVVEVKGGTLSYDATRAVWRRREAGQTETRDPVQQAKRARSVLRRALRSMGTDTSTLALRWVVATPECRLDAPGAPVLDAAQLWDALAADQLPHRNVLRGFASHPFVLVRGAAGTGKTVLAVEAAVQYASLGHRVLLGCWNVVLARWLRAAVRRELEAVGSPAAAEVTADPTGRVVVSHLVDLARHGDPPAPGDDEGTWYLETLPSALTPAVTAGEFDVVVLDEAQDLSELWVLAVASLVARAGRWYAFADGQQDLFDADASLPDFLEVEHELRENFPQLAGHRGVRRGVRRGRAGLRHR